jgi:hypothetical protein
MGGVLTTNIGPNDETYQFFSACGPIVQGYPEPSLYHLAKDTVGIAPGCPDSACVKAGRLEFGSKGEQMFAIGLVWFTLVTSILLWIFYTCALCLQVVPSRKEAITIRLIYGKLLVVTS